jgi:hypothetical protein
VAALAVVVAGAFVAHAITSAPSTGRLVVQVQAAAEVRIDGVAVTPPLVVGEARGVEVRAGAHRVEFVAADGSRSAATVEVRAGATQELLGVEIRGED